MVGGLNSRQIKTYFTISEIIMKNQWKLIVGLPAFFRQVSTKVAAISMQEL